MHNVIGRSAWLPAIKFDSCNKLLGLSSVHTACIIASFCVLSVSILNENVVVIIVIIIIIIIIIITTLMQIYID